MTLGLFLAIGESLTDFKKKGQVARLVNYNLKKYAQTFDEVFVFTYQKEQFKLPQNCILVTPPWKIHRYLYAVILPIIQFRTITKCDILRGLQLTGGIPAAIAKLIFGKKFIINYGYNYANIAQIENKKIQATLYKLIEWPILNLADALIVTSQNLQKIVSQSVSPQKIRYIPNGVDLKLFNPKNITKSNKQLKLIYLGRLEKQKNLESLIEAVASINKSIKLIFYGNGSLKRSLARLAHKLKVELEIRLPVAYQKVPQVLAQADIFILPSFEEGNPKILLEAQACGMAVIGSNVSGIKELILDGQTGILTAIDSKSIAKAIIKLQDNRLRQKLGKGAREHIIKNYDINKLLIQEANLLRNIAQRND